MKITAISKIYWKLIKAGSKAYEEVVGEDKKDEVKELAKEDVRSRTITPEKYEEYIKEAYPEEIPSEPEEEQSSDETGQAVEEDEEPEEGEAEAEAE